MSETKSDSAYTRQLTDCSTLPELQALVTLYADLAADAVPIVAVMSDADFKEFRRGLKSERKGRFAGEPWVKRFGAILMPLPMMTISQVAEECNVPFGVAWLRLKEHRPDLLRAESQERS